MNTFIDKSCCDPTATEMDLSSPPQAVLQERYREATRGHLKHLPTLFHALTGLRCRVAWGSNGSLPWDEHALPTRSPLCRCFVRRNPTLLKRCRKCAAHHVKRALESGHNGHSFTCFLGVRNHWLPVVVRHKTVGLAYVQTLDLDAASPCARDNSGPSARRALSDTSRKPAGKACRSAKRMGRAQFNRAARLLDLIFEHAESLTVSELRKADLAKTQEALGELQTVATHLRQDLNGLMPSISKTTPSLQPLSRPERIAQDALDYLRQHYTQPITLRTCAEALGLSPAYLSDVFSHRVGLPFKSYLTEIRLEKAMQLLSESDMNLSQVAAAVGYASENRFRVAFKKATGVSPRTWRETLQMRPEPPSLGEGI